MGVSFAVVLMMFSSTPCATALWVIHSWPKLLEKNLTTGRDLVKLELSNWSNRFRSKPGKMT